MGSILSAISITLGEMARLCLLALVFFSVFTAHSSGSSLRLQRDVCQQYEDCKMNAYAVYQSAMTSKPDDRPDWRARKTCTYMTTTIQDCATQQIGECYTEEEVAILIDEEIPKIMAQLSTTIKEWNSDLCPVVEDYLNRNGGTENTGNEKETVSEGETEGEGETGEESSNGKTESGSEVSVASISLVIILYTIFSA